MMISNGAKASSATWRRGGDSKLASGHYPTTVDSYIAFESLEMGIWPGTYFRHYDIKVIKKCNSE